MKLTHLAPWIPEVGEDRPCSALEGAYDAAERAVREVFARATWSYAQHVERLMIGPWVEVFTTKERCWPFITMGGGYNLKMSAARRTAVKPLLFDDQMYPVIPDGADRLINSARAAAEALVAHVDRAMICGYIDLKRHIPGIADLLGMGHDMATEEVVLQEVARRKREGRLPEGWARARAVISVEFEHTAPSWVPPRADNDEPVLQSVLMTRIAGVVPEAVRAR
jgi:hypothetical protein